MPDRSTNENKAVEAYLQYLATGVLPASKDNDDAIEVLDQRIANEDRLHVKVVLIAERHRLANPPPPDASPLVERFVQYAATFSERNKITYAVWREMGVPAKVLKEAGIPATKLFTTVVNGVPRQRAFAPRRQWSDEEKAEYVAIYEAKGVEAAMAHFNVGSTVHASKQRFFKFRRDLGLPPTGTRGRPRKAS